MLHHKYTVSKIFHCRERERERIQVFINEESSLPDKIQNISAIAKSRAVNHRYSTTNPSIT